MEPFGHFPFGRANSVRPPRRPSETNAEVMLVGVYPSAWHVTWKAPSYLSNPGRRGSVAALAVNVEPTVFWNGDPTDFGPMLRQWTEATGFIEGDRPGTHGWISPVPPAANGSSGTKVEERYLAPMGISAHSAAFTDVYPVFVVKGSPRSRPDRREQGDAIREEYDSIADSLGFSGSTIPVRPTPKQLVEDALAHFSERIVQDLESADAPVVVTLGDEALQVLRRIRTLNPEPPGDTLTELYGDAYGRPGALTVNGRRTEWIALAHPGLLKGTPERIEIDPARRSGPGWNWLHARWAANQSR